MKFKDPGGKFPEDYQLPVTRKPIDFSKLNTLMEKVKRQNARREPQNEAVE